jgi:thiamine pyrophosphokinase
LKICGCRFATDKDYTKIDPVNPTINKIIETSCARQGDFWNKAFESTKYFHVNNLKWNITEIHLKKRNGGAESQAFCTAALKRK